MSNSPPETFRYCPLCAAELVPPPPGESGAYCPEHDRSWYRNSSPAIGCALVRDGRALVTVRGIEPEKGRYDVPGGFLEPGEHPVDGLRREVREELGVEVESVRGPIVVATHRYGAGGEYVLALGFTASIALGEPAPDDDVASFAWVSAEEAGSLDFAWEHDRGLVRAALEGETVGGMRWE